MRDTDNGGGITMYGADWCPDCKRAKQFFGEHRIEYDYIDIDNNAEAQARIEEINDGNQSIPTILFPDGNVLVEPSNAELAAQLNIKTEASMEFYDLVVVGSGPAGLTAALYAAREGIESLVIERSGVGGQAGITDRLDNFPGFPEGVSGDEFAHRLRTQAERFGVEILAAQEATGIEVNGSYRTVRLADGQEICSRAILLATGSTYRRLDIPGEEDFIGAGVHFCATCDGPFYRDKDVVVIGGGNSAGEEGLFLTRFARSVTIVNRNPELSASEIVVRRVEDHPEVELRNNVIATEFKGDRRLESVVLEDIVTGETSEVRPDGVFVFIGQSPNTEMARSVVEVDERGYIKTYAALNTSVDGIFAAGDCRAGSTKQAASAAGEGAAAALAIRSYLDSHAVAAPSTQHELALA